MNDQLPPGDLDSLSQEEWNDILDEGDDRDIDFWKGLKEEGKGSFEKSLHEIENVRNRAIEFMKMTLILGSFYVALFQYGAGDFQLIPSDYLIIIPLSPLLVSLFLFVFTYMSPGSHSRAPNSRNAYTSISNGYSELEYTKIMAIVYFIWSDENFDLSQRSIKYQFYGIGCMFSSLGAMAFLLLTT